mgnify:CR=1 FL=1
MTDLTATPGFTIKGWHVLADLVGCEHDAVHIGMPVEVEFFAHPGGVTLPYFHPIV